MMRKECRPAEGRQRRPSSFSSIEPRPQPALFVIVALGQYFGPRLATLAAPLGPLRGFDKAIFDLPRRDPHDMDGVADHVGGAFLALAPRGMGLALGPSNERLELLMKRGDWRQAADRFRLLPDCVPRRFGEGFPLKNDGGPEILKGDIVALL